MMLTPGTGYFNMRVRFDAILAANVVSCVRCDWEQKYIGKSLGKALFNQHVCERSS